jgi:hypothetical protein
MPPLDASSFASSETLAHALEQGGQAAAQPAALLKRMDQAFGADVRKASGEEGVPSNLRPSRGKVKASSRLGHDFAASRDSASRLQDALKNLSTAVDAVAAAGAGSGEHVAAVAAAASTMCAAFATVQVAPLLLPPVSRFRHQAQPWPPP